MVLYNRTITHYKFEPRKLGTLLQKKPQYGANEPGKERLSLDEPRYIRITDVDEYGLLRNEVGVTADVIEDQYLLENNDLLFARSGATVGKAYIHKTESVDYPCFFAGYMIRLVVNSELISPDYLFAFTQLGVYQKWVQAVQRAAGQPNINAEEYKSLPIPLPSKEVQENVVAKINAAYELKKQKEAAAQQLLDGIDDYLLEALGIEKPLEEKNDLQNRVFYRKLSDVTGSRLDPLFHTQGVYKMLEGSTYPMERLKDVVQHLQTGFAAGKQDQARQSEGIVQIRPTNISPARELIFEKNVLIDYVQKEHHENDLLRRNEVLFNNTNSQELVGKTVLFDLDGDYFCSNHITRISLNENVVSPRYLTALLNMYQRRKVFFKICTNWNNQSGVNNDALAQVNIPLPSLMEQQTIAQEIASIRLKAKQLRGEASNTLEQAKREVEAMILGEAA